MNTDQSPEKEVVRKWRALNGVTPEKVETMLKWFAEKNIPPELIYELGTVILDNEEWFPVPAIVTKYLKKLKPSGLKAYRIACNTCERYSCEDSITFQEPKIAEAIRLIWGTWEKFGLDERDPTWRKKDFLEAWNTLEYIHCNDGYLPGRKEREWKKDFKINMISNKGLLIESKSVKMIRNNKLIASKQESEVNNGKD